MKISRQRISTKSKSAGFSLLELLLVVGVAAVLIIAGVAAYSLVSGGQKAGEAERQVFQIKAAIKNAFPDGRYPSADLTVTNMIKTKAFSGMKNATTAPLDPWGGTVSVAGTAANGTTFTIGFPGVPAESCVDIAMATAKDADITKIQGAGTAQNITLAAPLTPAKAFATCTGEGLVWTFK